MADLLRVNGKTRKKDILTYKYNENAFDIEMYFWMIYFYRIVIRCKLFYHKKHSKQFYDSNAFK